MKYIYVTRYSNSYGAKFLVTPSDENGDYTGETATSKTGVQRTIRILLRDLGWNRRDVTVSYDN